MVLKIKLQQVESQFQQLKEEYEQNKNKLQIMKIIIGNNKELISNLPPNSPFRSLLLGYLVNGLKIETAMNIFGIFLRTYIRIKEDQKIL